MSTKNSDSFIWCCNINKGKDKFVILNSGIVPSKLHLQIHRYLIQLWQRNYDATSLPLLTALLVKSQWHSFFTYNLFRPQLFKRWKHYPLGLGVLAEVLCFGAQWFYKTEAKLFLRSRLEPS